MEHAWALLVFASNPDWRQWLQEHNHYWCHWGRYFPLELISVTSRIKKTWKLISQPKLTVSSFTTLFKRQQHWGKNELVNCSDPKGSKMNYSNCHWNNKTKALSDWTECWTPARSCCHIPRLYICSLWERVQCFLGTAKHRAELTAYLHLEITVLDVYLETSFFRSRQNAHCSIIRNPQYSKWQWWQFTVFLNSTSGSNFLKNKVHSPWGHSKAFRHALKAYPSSIKMYSFYWA